MVKFITVKGNSTYSATPFYYAVPQHERSMTKREAYECAAEQTGFKPTAIRAVFMALAEYIRENQARGNITFIDDVASVRNYVKGSFATLTGPWVKGTNRLFLNAVAMNPFKGFIGDVALVNRTEGANPKINTVLDETTREYDEITGLDVFSIAGSDLGPDVTKDDEYVTLIDPVNGGEWGCDVTYSDLANVKAKLITQPPAGEYTLAVYTRSGMGEEFGVKKVTKKVFVKVP